MANIKQIKLPSGTTYDIVDQGARDLIDALSGYTVFLGVTTTPLIDGSTTNPIVIDGNSITATAGAIVTYGSAEFIFNGTAWQAFGDLSGLGDLAYYNSARGKFTPTGTVTAPAFTGTAATISTDYTPSGTVTAPAFTGTQSTINASFTPAGTVTISKGTGTANYTPSGSLNAPAFTGSQATINAAFTPAGTVTISKGTGTANYTPSGNVSLTAPTVTLSTTTGRFITGTGSLPSAVMPVLTTTVANECLTLSWTSGSWDAGSLPTMGNSTTVATGVSSVTSGTATFTGTGVELKGSFSGTAGTATATYTPSGTVAAPTFTGTGVELKGTFSGTAGTATATYTPSGTVAQPAFNGSAATISVNYTPSGTVAQPTFEGDQDWVYVIGY